MIEAKDIRHEEHNRRGAFFVVQNGKRIAVMTYSRASETLVILDHTQVDSSLGGQGVARKLLDAAVTWVRANKTRVMVTCPFANAQFAKDSSIRDVLA